eukprot:snap_masked-scaffold_24-processed-gene-2.30-mRNA-1 protein AED:1.00 eAED:1.00 QI:0/0/0/0/1/1/2/0/101
MTNYCILNSESTIQQSTNAHKKTIKGSQPPREVLKEHERHTVYIKSNKNNIKSKSNDYEEENRCRFYRKKYQKQTGCSFSKEEYEKETGCKLNKHYEKETG